MTNEVLRIDIWKIYNKDIHFTYNNSETIFQCKAHEKKLSFLGSETSEF